MGLVARYLESNGIPTVVLGAAHDIVTHCGVPRFAFLDFPLGNPCGKPYDRAMQAAIVGAAIDVFETARGPGNTVSLPYRWRADESWRDGYYKVGDENIDELRRAGEERRAMRAKARETGQVRTE